ncbi:uncharacterized protein LOC133193649 [Saccostrea echinata]|uniref:uncharacterized protein LOC133193649 n=1 Tax=Saccostrea echinata TaxID=191078 RepID=UPI002A83C83D|nr:uncharacterized protein LOC133193649 [Saccostrea echinata]
MVFKYRVYVVLLSSLCMVLSQSCPKECICRSNDVKCPASVNFPESFPSNTEKIVFDEITAVEIPPNAFAHLPNLTSIHFSRCNFGQISSCAFPRKHKNLRITFDLAVIGEVKEGAFKELGVTSISFTKSTVTTIRAYAFWDIKTDFKLTFTNTTVHKIESFAFYNVSSENDLKYEGGTVKYIMNSAIKDCVFTTVKLKRVLFEKLECDSFLAIVKNNPQVSDIGFLCNCDTEWMKTINPDPLFAMMLATGSCRGPVELEGASMKDILENNRVQNCPEVSNVGRTCQRPSQDIPEFTCTERIIMGPSGPDGSDNGSGSKKKPPGGHASLTYPCWTLIAAVIIISLNL